MEKFGFQHHTEESETDGEHSLPPTPVTAGFKEKLMEKLMPPVYEIVIRKDDIAEPHGILKW